MISYKKLQKFLNEDTCVEAIDVFDNNKTLISQLEIHVEGSEGKIPCFNIRRKGTDEICRIKFLSAEYLRNKKDPFMFLNEYEKKALNDSLHKIVPSTDISKWQLYLMHWNITYPKFSVRMDSNLCPNYNELRENENM